MANATVDKNTTEKFIKDIISSKSLDKTKIITVLQQVQHEFGYLSREALTFISQQLKIPEIDVFGVATFYAQFRFNKPGKHPVKVCEGTACHVRGGKALMQAVERELHISHGETTEDERFSLERVACLGCCALAPVMVVDEDVYGSCTTTKVGEILKNIRGVD